MKTWLIGVLLYFSSLSFLLADDDVNGVKISDAIDGYAYSVDTIKVGEVIQSIDLGFANTTGNTNTLNFNGKYTFAYARKGYDDKTLHIGFNTSAFRTEDDSQITNEEYTSKLHLDQVFENKWLVYTFVSWLRNEFRNFDNKWVTGVGIGKVLFDDENHVWKAKVGVAYNHEDYSNEQTTETFTSLTQYLEYTNSLNTTSKLYLKAGASENFEDFSNDYELLGVLGLDFVVSTNLHVIIEEEVSYNAVPPVGFKKTDTKSIIRLGYTF
jgi:putative salt-induced outer membrane protein